ncbi:MAG: AhpC/TSA family protein [Bacteroidales bacterium]|nr:AhpC/TSA family protein [Bacteroidales bacterium]
MKRISFLLLLALIVAACQDKNTFTVKGVLKGKTGKYIYINKVDVNTPILIDSAKIGKNGSFRLNVKCSEPDFYQLGFSTANFITLLAEPSERIILTFNDTNLYKNYSIAGSPGSSKLQVLDGALASTKSKLDSLTAIYNKSSNEPGFDVKGAALETQFSNLIKEQRKKNIEFIITNINSLASIKALYQTITPDTYVLYEPNDLQYLKIVTDSLTRHYPNSKHVQALARDLSNELNKMYVEKLGALANELPQANLDPDLMDSHGKRIALSSLRGKYVLLTFWSFTSKDCVVENLQLKEYYKRYRNKGFEIYQINIDQSEADWKKAVQYDELPWISTREDDPANPANARLFNVTRLPSNFLFDKEGKIIGSNLHNRSLQIKLQQLFPN